MPILQIDTYDRAIFESVMPFTDEDLTDRETFPSLPTSIATVMEQYVKNNQLPSVRQPLDGMVYDGDKIIVTLTWLDLTAAQEYVADKISRADAGAMPALISSVVEVRD